MSFKKLNFFARAKIFLAREKLLLELKIGKNLFYIKNFAKILLEQIWPLLE
jgi:hypothetical protein